MIARHLPDLKAAALVLPLVAFLAVFFLWPLASIFTTAVSDTEVSRAFPELGRAIDGWDGQAPTPAMQQALVADIRTTPQATMGDAVRRLNSQTSGFRSLFGRTQQAVARGTGPVDLVALDGRWADPLYWNTIRSALPPYTPRFLLSALDLQQGAEGIEVAGQSVHVQIFLRTLGISALVTGLCALIGVPFAMLMLATTGWVRNVLMASVLLPMWTSVLVRCTAWLIILQNDGVLSRILQTLGGLREAVPLLFTRSGVIIAMTHVMLPFMILSIYSVLIAMPKNLMPAAASMGANPIAAFRTVLLPLALPGIVSGGLLVFMTSLGFYILPALLGGGNDQLISSFVAEYAIRQANWPLASALGLILLIVTVVIFALYQRLSTRMAGA
ncbi:ABC transporter permease [Falsirhodobacter sp. 20TX0035]|uniref:ABC transporter permease n=1 Tax=Falsirhodobacter sp. 20TX0035 TaxID=3022019 RepID=UPI00232C6542|nr:ABC transporter permease [Falsirhodobacter sp. 20TX0035]MDB6454096.1 ABC transporter permease [Falsirhodobacter sp. 20TX0035]